MNQFSTLQGRPVLTNWNQGRPNMNLSTDIPSFLPLNFCFYAC